MSKHPKSLSIVFIIDYEVLHEVFVTRVIKCMKKDIFSVEHPAEITEALMCFIEDILYKEGLRGSHVLKVVACSATELILMSKYRKKKIYTIKLKNEVTQKEIAHVTHVMNDIDGVLLE